MVGVIFIDFKRVFETVDREKLLEKLFQYGIKGTVLKWLRSYLENITQQVRFNNKWSKSLTTKYGVPQGSVLGPLLFIIYINDIVKTCPEGYNIKMFADDTIIYVSGESSIELENKINIIFNKVEKWMNINRLKINADKTKYMIVRGVRKEIKGNMTVKSLDGTELERVKTTKYLGVIIDDRLQFNDHCNYMLRKIRKKTSFLNRIGSNISVYTRCMVYKTIIAPHFEYGATLLINMGETQLNRLQKAQNRAMRVILQCDRYTRIECMLNALQFMNIRQRLYYNLCILIFRMLKCMSTDHFKNMLEVVGNISERQTRQAGDIMMQYRRTRSTQKSIFYEGIKMYNGLPIEIKRCDRIELFKRRLKQYISTNVE